MRYKSGTKVGTRDTARRPDQRYEYEVRNMKPERSDVIVAVYASILHPERYHRTDMRKVFVSIRQWRRMYKGKMQAVFCICGCGEVLLIKDKEYCRMICGGWRPIRRWCYTRIRRRFRGAARRSAMPYLMWVRPRGTTYNSRKEDKRCHE